MEHEAVDCSGASQTCEKMFFGVMNLASQSDNPMEVSRFCANR